MRRIQLICVSVALWGLIGQSVSAQRPERERGAPGGLGGQMMRMMPLMAAIDADGNGEISSDEIEKAVAALKGIDKNKDGKLTEDELRPNFPPGVGGPGGPGRPGGPGGLFGGGGNPEEFLGRLLEMDRNKDGKLAKDEMPERLQPLFARADTDKDGFISKDELAKVAVGGGRGQERGQEEGPRGDRPAGDRPEGNRPEEGRPREGRGFPGFGFGPPNPEEIVNRLFELDSDKDQKLSREELGKIAEVMSRLFGRPGEGRGGERRAGEGSGRPQRPQ